MLSGSGRLGGDTRGLRKFLPQRKSVSHIFPCPLQRQQILTVADKSQCCFGDPKRGCDAAFKGSSRCVRRRMAVENRGLGPRDTKQKSL